MNGRVPPRESRSQASDPAVPHGHRIVRFPDLHRRGVAGLLHPKGNLSPTALRVLGILAFLPFLTIMIRVLALPGIVCPGLCGLGELGNYLNQTWSLSAVPPDQRNQVLYLLLLPTCALIIALARLTFGIRVLGFRSILIAVGFHQSGVVPSLLLITIGVVAIVLVRPWLRRIRLPYYARVSVILCVVATTMVGILLAGPWMHSDVLWGVAYFPVIVLGMLAEGIARTLDRDNVVAASWRAITTILLAFLIALVCWTPALRNILLQFPELVVTQIIAIVMISEFLDLRLFQDWDAKVARALLPALVPRADSRRVAVVRNRIDTRVMGRMGVANPRKHALRSVQKIVDALRNGGYTVKVIEGGPSLPKELSRFFLSSPHGGAPEGIVFNLAHGARGVARTTHVPAMLEMSGIAYIGPTPLGHAMAIDRVVAKVLMQQAAVPTPAFRIMASPSDEAEGIPYPSSVGPRHDPSAKAKVVENRRQLRAAVKKIVQHYRQEAFVEEFVAGQHISVALLGNSPVECLPLVELDSERGKKICPASLDDALADRIREYAKATFRSCGCRDYARIDVCVGESGDVWVLEARTLGILAREGSFVRAGAAAGYTFNELVCKIVEVARARYLSDESLHPVHPHSQDAPTGELLTSGTRESAPA
jgi:D-alanine-D-alanine ligase